MRAAPKEELSGSFGLSYLPLNTNRLPKTTMVRNRPAPWRWGGSEKPANPGAEPHGDLTAILSQREILSSFSFILSKPGNCQTIGTFLVYEKRENSSSKASPLIKNASIYKYPNTSQTLV